MGVLESIKCLSDSEVAEILGVSTNRVAQLVRSDELGGLTANGKLQIPADFLQQDSIVKGLSGVLTLLRDAGYSQEEAIRWLFTDDESLPGTPIDALRDNRGKEVRRRAQSMGF